MSFCLVASKTGSQFEPPRLRSENHKRKPRDVVISDDPIIRAFVQQTALFPHPLSKRESKKQKPEWFDSAIAQFNPRPNAQAIPEQKRPKSEEPKLPTLPQSIFRGKSDEGLSEEFQSQWEKVKKWYVLDQDEKFIAKCKTFFKLIAENPKNRNPYQMEVDQSSLLPKGERGVFATRRIRAGEILGFYPLNIAKTPESDEKNVYLFGLPFPRLLNNYVLKPEIISPDENFTPFVNDFGNYNAQFREFYTDERPVIVLVSTRTIQAGEEIEAEYGAKYWKDLQIIPIRQPTKPRPLSRPFNAAAGEKPLPLIPPAPPIPAPQALAPAPLPDPHSPSVLPKKPPVSRERKPVVLKFCNQAFIDAIYPGLKYRITGTEFPGFEELQHRTRGVIKKVTLNGEVWVDLKPEPKPVPAEFIKLANNNFNYILISISSKTNDYALLKLNKNEEKRETAGGHNPGGLLRGKLVGSLHEGSDTYIFGAKANGSKRFFRYVPLPTHISSAQAAIEFLARYEIPSAEVNGESFQGTVYRPFV